MNQGKYIFAQLIVFLPKRAFDRIVAKYAENKNVRSFTYWIHMQSLVFGLILATEVSQF